MMKRSVALVTGAFLLPLLLAGVAHAGPITPSPASVPFADTGTGACDGPKTIDLQNKSGAAVSITDIQLTGADAGQFNMNPPGVPITLVDGVTISMDVSFCPTGASGPRSANVSLTIKGQMAVTDIPLSGKAIGPKITVTPNPVVIGGVKLGANVAPVSVTVSNSGGGSIKVTSVTPSGGDAAKFTFTGLPAFPQTLGPSANFKFNMNYAPVAKGPAAVTVHVVSDDPVTPILDAPVQAYVGDPKVSLSLANLLFGNINVGLTTDSQDVDISNTGYSDLTVSGVTLAGNNPGDFKLVSVNPAPPFSLKVGNTARFTVNCTPTLAGNRTASVSVASDDPLSPKLLPVSCLGTLPATMIDAGPIDFGAVRVTMPKKLPVTIRNSGDGPVTINAISVVDKVQGGKNAAAYELDVQAPFDIAPKGSKVVNVTFTPPGIAIFDKVALTISTNDPKLPTGQVDLTGSGVSPMLVVDPLAIDFAVVVVGTKAGPKNFTVKNTGNDTLKVTAFQIGGPGQVAFSFLPAVKLPFTIAPGITNTYQVFYEPTDNSGDSASILINTDDPKNGDANITLDGVGAQAIMSTVPADMDMLNFESTAQGAVSKALSVKISNTGTAPLVIKAVRVTKGPMDMPVPSTDFSIPAADAMGFSVDPNKSKTIPVTFTPSTAMALTGTLEIIPDDAVDPSIQPVYIFLAGQGLPTSVNCITAAGDNSLDFGQVMVGAMSAALPITVLNGAMNAQPIVVSSGATQFTVDKMTASIPGNQKITVNALFTPDTAQKFTGVIKITLPNSTTPLCSIPVKGEGVTMGGGGSDAGPVNVPSRGCSMGSRGTAAGPAVMLLLLGLGLVVRRRSRRA